MLPFCPCLALSFCLMATRGQKETGFLASLYFFFPGFLFIPWWKRKRIPTSYLPLSPTLACCRVCGVCGFWSVFLPVMVPILYAGPDMLPRWSSPPMPAMPSFPKPRFSFSRQAGLRTSPGGWGLRGVAVRTPFTSPACKQDT